MLSNVHDCDVQLGPEVILDTLVIGITPGPRPAPSVRVRIRGGQLGSVNLWGRSTDLVLDGVIINPGVVTPSGRSGAGLLLHTSGSPDDVVNRAALINSIIRMVPIPVAPNEYDGCAYIGTGRNLFFANNNIVTAGNHNSWGFRLSGNYNMLFVDNAVRVSFHKFIRMNDHPVDYVYIKGGTWMREATKTPNGDELNDSWAQLSDTEYTDNVYVHDASVYLLSEKQVGFGQRTTPIQANRSWEARRIHWHAKGPTVISDALLAGMQKDCVPKALCDYGIGTHQYSYDPNLAFPKNPWRDLPTIANDDPDALK
jgi:hypothetical protein